MTVVSLLMSQLDIKSGKISSSHAGWNHNCLSFPGRLSPCWPEINFRQVSLLLLILEALVTTLYALARVVVVKTC